MQRFVQLFTELDQTTRVNDKIDALVRYFHDAREEDMLWTIALLSHRRPKRTVTTSLLREWAAEAAGIPLWLFEESYHVVGDLAETISLVLPSPVSANPQSLSYWINFIRNLGDDSEIQRKAGILGAWEQMEAPERFLFNKLITGGFRVGVSQQLLVKALAQYSGVEQNILAHRLMGNWSPDDNTLEHLLLGAGPQEDISKPYPFYLAYALDDEIQTLGQPEEWIAERKWDGIRGQLIVRKGELFVWSRGEELMTDKFPEFHVLAGLLPDGTVLDGEILPFKAGKLLPFQFLQTRIGRKNITRTVLDSAPVVLRAYDLLEFSGEDIRHLPFRKRREQLEQLLQAYPVSVLQLSEVLRFDDWESLHAAREDSREYASEGLMLKRADSAYRAGRRRGDWWKWKVDAMTVDAVMIYAQQGHGRRANLYTDFTFAVWKDKHLVPFTKSYSGLTDAEFQEINAWIRQNTVERFGPVRSVRPELVFEIAFEGIQPSTRHKSGIALRFPRIHRWRRDKPAREANTLEDLQELLRRTGG
jgi:DNA ligase-1